MKALWLRRFTLHSTPPPKKFKYSTKKPERADGVNTATPEETAGGGGVKKGTRPEKRKRTTIAVVAAAESGGIDDPKCMKDMLDRQLAFPLQIHCRGTGGKSCYITQSTRKFKFVVGLSETKSSNYVRRVKDAKAKAEAGDLKTKRDMIDFVSSTGTR